MAIPTVGQGPTATVGPRTEIPTPEEFERSATARIETTETTVDQITRVILSQLSARSELPAEVTFELPWWKAPSVSEVLDSFRQRGWKARKNHCVSIFGIARFEIEFSK